MPWDCCDKNEVDIVISDIRMPDMSGVELLKEAKKIAPEAVFILITAFASTETAIDALQHGAYDYLTKPFKMEELLNIVRHSLEKKSLKREVAIAEERDRRPAGAEALSGAASQPSRRQEPENARGLPDDRHRRHGRKHRAHRRRKRNRQGTGGARHPRGIAAARTALSSPSTAAPSRKLCSKASCSDT